LLSFLKFLRCNWRYHTHDGPWSPLHSPVSPRLLVYCCRSMLCISPAYAVMRCLSVCPAVTFVYSIEMNKHIFKLFSPSGSQSHHSTFPYQTLWQYSDGNPRNGGVVCRRGRHNSRFSTNRWLSIDDCCSANNCDRPACSLPHTTPRASVNLCLSQPAWTTTAKRRKQNKIYLYSSVCLKQNLRSPYCIIEATDRHEASRGLSATTGLLFM